MLLMFGRRDFCPIKRALVGVSIDLFSFIHYAVLITEIQDAALSL